MKINQLLAVIKDTLFPKFCLGCSKEGFVVCNDCKETIEIDKVMLCPVCKKEQKIGMCCNECNKHSFLDLHIAIFNYEGLKSSLIEELKYNYITEVLPIFADFISEFVNNNSDLFADNAVIVPVPLHKKRYAQRGFNQAKLIADILAQELDIDLKKLLCRTRNTKKQMKLNQDKRQTNIKNAFALDNSIDVNSNHVILVDDVFTTGSTLQECGKVVEDQFETVAGFTLARGG